MNKDLIKWLRKEAARNCRLKNQEWQTCRRKRTFRHRVHRLNQAADQIESLNAENIMLIKQRTRFVESTGE